MANTDIQAADERPTGDDAVEEAPTPFSVQANHAERRARVLDLVAGMTKADALHVLAGKVATAEMLIAPVAVKNGGWLQFSEALAQRNNKFVDIPSEVTADGALVRAV